MSAEPAVPPRIEDEQNCEGYYGFGAGVLIGRALPLGPQAAYHPENQNYCAGLCTRKELCWWRHKGRVVFNHGALTALLEGLAHDPLNPLTGPPLLEEYARQTRQDTTQGYVEPYLNVMGGNIEDGMSVAAGRGVKDRGRWTLPWPFPPMEPEA